MKILSALLILGAAITVAYWLNYFLAGDVRVLPDYWYAAFEDSFPAADGWMALACSWPESACGAARKAARCGA